MSGGRATRAIAGVTLRRAAAYLDGVTLVAMLLGIVLPRFAPLAFAAAVGWAVFETLGSAHAWELTSLRYFAAPLYGREVARAHALVAGARFACTAAAVAALLGLAVALPYHVPPGAWNLLTAMTLAQIVTVLVAMSGTLRRGRERGLYVALALAAGLTIDGIASPGTPLSLLCAAVIAAALGFAALRAFGETLARYDPVD